VVTLAPAFAWRRQKGLRDLRGAHWFAIVLHVALASTLKRAARPLVGVAISLTCVGSLALAGEATDTALPGLPPVQRPERATARAPSTPDLIPVEVTAIETFQIVSVNTGEDVTVEMSGPLGAASEASMRAVTHLFRCLRTGKEEAIAPALVSVLARLAREVGGKLELVSGYRTPANGHDHSYHGRAEAADVRVPGMTAFKLRQVAQGLGVAGLGTYPTTRMIHVDVREVPYAWTDWSGPSQRSARRAVP
jgi:uncharacterized protein YcbK (DUF882 family)